ncbi:hypothetical protein B0A50_01991 [Salinomyces thailandicus]|uniref:Uncharacterized protein n=1 Tax=Salinomyces thailandicus TaxID=706561 RepID=A0A4U0U734_9PEZI|nr:hypothetical protein B0A50_01991 [Salinomyces thailandica]
MYTKRRQSLAPSSTPRASKAAFFLVFNYSVSGEDEDPPELLNNLVEGDVELRLNRAEDSDACSSPLGSEIDTSDEGDFIGDKSADNSEGADSDSEIEDEDVLNEDSEMEDNTSIARDR